MSDKTPKINHYYTPEYYQLLKDKKYEKVLEIGIGYPDLMCRFTNDTYKAGASLYMWKEYFETSEIFGCDIRDIQLEGIKTFVCDQSDTLQLENMMDKIGNVDFILDQHGLTVFMNLGMFKDLLNVEFPEQFNQQVPVGFI